MKKRILYAIVAILCCLSSLLSLAACDTVSVVTGVVGDQNNPNGGGENGLTPHIGENGNWWIGTNDTGVKAEGADGKDGSNGKNGVDGKDGANGKDGVNGKDGKDGKDGVSVVDAYVDEYNHLILNMSDGSVIDAGCIHQTVILPAIEPTCLSYGQTEGKYCSICGQVFVESTLIPALGAESHNYINGYCSICGTRDPSADSGSSSNPGYDFSDDGVQYPDVVNMGYYQYNAYVRGTVSGNGSFYCEDFWVDPTTGGADALSYSVIQRNNEIEKTYKCKIVQTWSTEYNMYSEMTTFFNVDKKFELAILVASDAATCAINGMLSDLKSSVNTQYMNLDNPAFDQNSIGQLTLGDNLYFLSGDMNISTMDCTMATVFNVEYFQSIADGLVETLGDEMYGDVYQMVEDGNWTLSNMLKMADAVVVDVDSSDGDLSFDKGDTIGYFQYFASPLYYYYAAGMRITDNEGGYPVFTITGEEEREVYEYIFDSLNVNLNPMLPSGYSSERALNFLSGQVLFTDYILWDIRRVLYPAEANVYYGILPNPVINEGDDYHSLVYFETTVHLWSIPYKRANAEYSARMFEVMAAYSDARRDSTMEAYYIKTMYMNVAKDDGSRASLDIIRDCLVYDIALMYSHNTAGDLWGNFDDLLLNAASARNYQYDAFTGESQMTNANKQLQDTIDAFMAMSEG